MPKRTVYQWLRWFLHINRKAPLCCCGSEVNRVLQAIEFALPRWLQPRWRVKQISQIRMIYYYYYSCNYLCQITSPAIVMNGHWNEIPPQLPSFPQTKTNPCGNAFQFVQSIFRTSALVNSFISCWPRMCARFSSWRNFSRMTGVGRLTSSASIMLPSRSMRRFCRASAVWLFMRRARSISFTGDAPKVSSEIATSSQRYNRRMIWTFSVRSVVTNNTAGYRLVKLTKRHNHETIIPIAICNVYNCHRHLSIITLHSISSRVKCLRTWRCLLLLWMFISIRGGHWGRSGFPYYTIYEHQRMRHGLPHHKTMSLAALELSFDVWNCSSVALTQSNKGREPVTKGALYSKKSTRRQ